MQYIYCIMPKGVRCDKRGRLTTYNNSTSASCGSGERHEDACLQELRKSVCVECVC